MLTLPPKFKQALGNGTRTSLYPLVRIYKGVQIDDPIPEEASINLSIKETNIGGEAYNPLLLNSPSISSKADIINNKYTISSVSLSISNAPYNGKIFSDDIPSLLNAVVQVYYAANGLDSLENCLLVYTGTIRRYNQSAETLNLTLEDLTQQKLATKIPSTLIEDQENFYDKDISTPYPMTYGYVDKAPLVLDKYNNLTIDKPNVSIVGAWSKISNVEYKNPFIKQTSLWDSWLTKESYLSVYTDGYMPIMKQYPMHFGSRAYESAGGSMYEINESSAQIILQPNNFIFEKYAEITDEDTDATYLSGVGKEGIPTRIVRNVENVSFFAKNYEEQFYYYNGSPDDDPDQYTFRPRSSNKFYGFFGEQFNEGISRDIVSETINYVEFGEPFDESNYIIQNNNDTIATDNYNASINNGSLNWWEPTELNIGGSGTYAEGIWDSKDLNFPLENQNFNPDWIQNASNTSGLHLHAVNRQNNQGGAFARLQLNQDVPDLPAVTKIFYNIDYYEADNIGDGWANNEQSDPSVFWVEKQLISRNYGANTSHGDLDEGFNKWDNNRDDEDWVTHGEVPNKHHTFEYASAPNRYTNDFGNESGDNYLGKNYDNIMIGFNSTNAYDSINWGIPRLGENGWYKNASSCFVNLRQFYVMQDILLQDYPNLNYYASIIGRTRARNLKLNITLIYYNSSIGSRITTQSSHRLDVGDTFNLYDDNDIYIGQYTCGQIYNEFSFWTEENVDLRSYNRGIVEHETELEATKSQDIFKDILEKELAYNKEIVLPDDSIKDDWLASFSLIEQQEAKSVIENLFKSSIYIPSFDSSGRFKFIDLKQNIEDYEQFEYIKNQDILKYSFSLTKLEDVKNQINVKYNKDYGAGDFSKETTYGIEDNNGNFVDTLDTLTQELNVEDMVYDISYYGMKNEDAKLEIESEYIRDKETARKLQRRLLMWYANQHLTRKLDLPPSYMHLEAGDYLRFEELIGGKLAFGFDYTQEFVKNGQLIYPVFFVTKVAKSLSKVSLELVQVHRGDFGMSDNDLGNYKIPNPYDNNIYNPETDVLEEDPYFDVELTGEEDLRWGRADFIVSTNFETDITYEIALVYSSHTFKFGDFEIDEGIQYPYPNDAKPLVGDYLVVTASPFGDNVSVAPNYLLQSRADIEYTEDSEEYIEDVNIELDYDITIKSTTNSDFEERHSFRQTIPPVYFMPGDLNGDGIINVQDIVFLVSNIILGDYGYYEQADLNNDGGNNILDIIIIANLILSN